MIELTRQAALGLHRKMWSDMKEKLGDNPSAMERYIFKVEWVKAWCKKTGYDHVKGYCFLCEYCHGICGKCPIDWSKAEGIFNQFGHVDCTDFYIKTDMAYYKSAPISLILAIPEREEGIIEDLL